MSGQARPGAGRKILLAVLAVVGSALVAAVGLFGLQIYERIVQRSRDAVTQAEKKVTEVAKDRSERSRAVVDVAPAPLPTKLPLVERPGNDAFGYPMSYVDEAAVRSLLYYERYQELSSYIEELQRSFEADPKKEMWPAQAADAFASAEPELLPKLEAWARATPASFAPHLALGAHWSAREQAARGGAFAQETAAQDFAAMHEAAKVALRHLNDALSKQPKLVVAQRYLMAVALLDGRRPLLDSALAAALRVCPGCYSVRVKYMRGLEPRWGGSFEAMTQFAAKAPLAANPKLKLLIGYVDAQRARVAREDERLDEALRFVNQACAIAPHADFLEERAEIWMAKDNLSEAQRDLDMALELRPELTSARMARAELYVKKHDWEDAARDILQVMRVSPTAVGARWAAGRAAWGLDQDGWEAHRRGDRERAIRLLELANQLVPFDRAVSQHMAEAVRGGVTGTPEELARLEARVKAAPDDFRAYQQLDYALANHRQYARVIEIWTEYLSRHPEDGHAYEERSGAYYNSGHHAEAAADADKACRAGINQACAFLKRMTPSPQR